MRGGEASGGGKRGWGEGGLGGHEKVEDADELVEEGGQLVDEVKRVEVSNKLLFLRVPQTPLNMTGRVLALVSFAIPLSSQHSLKYAKECL